MPELIDVISANFDYENFFSARLTAPMTASDTDVFLDAIPTPSEGVLVIDWDVAASREVIFYNSKTASKVTCPSVANGRGFDDTSATTHLSGANVIMAPVRAWFRLAQQLATTSEQGWKTVGYSPNTITNNGQRSYTLVFNSVDLTSFLSNGMRLEIPRTVTAPTTCFSLDGTNDYYNDTTPAGFSFTDDFTAGAWVKPTTYASNMDIITRFNGTSGFRFYLTDSTVRIIGYNAGAGNYSYANSYQTIRTNRWTHVAGRLDMSAFTYGISGSNNSQIWIDGVEVQGTVVRAGTNPTALVQAGSLNIGAYNDATGFFPGKIDQPFVASTKLTTAQIQALMNQGFVSGDVATYSLVSAYSNGSTTDINTTNANNLTAQSGATTATDSPFAQGADTVKTAGTTDYGVITDISFSTNTTVEVFVPEGSTIPTSGGVGTLNYSTFDTPYGFPSNKTKWEIESIYRQTITGFAIGAVNQWYGTSTLGLVVPKGSWLITHHGSYIQRSTVARTIESVFTLYNGTYLPVINAAYNHPLAGMLYSYSSVSASLGTVFATQLVDLPAQATFNPAVQIPTTSGTETFEMVGARSPVIYKALCAYI